MNEEQPGQPIEAQLVDAQQDEAQPPESQLRDARPRLRELLAIPDHERTDALWDEIVRLEIQLAPGNRAPSTQADAGRRREPGRRQEPGRRPEQVRRQQATSDAKRGKRFSKRPKRGPEAPTKTRESN